MLALQVTGIAFSYDSFFLDAPDVVSAAERPSTSGATPSGEKDDDDNASPAEEAYYSDDKGGTRIGDIYIPPPVQPHCSAESKGPRLIIKKIENDNFKSYADKVVLGPFYHCFTAIIGPNGSGKIIDSLLFVFGYRAQKIRCTKNLQIQKYLSEQNKKLEEFGVERDGFVKELNEHDEHYNNLAKEREESRCPESMRAHAAAERPSTSGATPSGEKDDADNAPPAEEAYYSDEEGGTRIGDIYIPPPVQPHCSAESKEPRLIIKKIENDNFKSYAGKVVLGPFYHCFTAIIGPNGSGRIIDSLLFVFGYRAQKIRCTKNLQIQKYLSEQNKKLGEFGVERDGFVKELNEHDEHYTNLAKELEESHCPESMRAHA